MKSFVSLVMLVMITMISNLAFAFNVPIHNGFVNDYAGKLTANQVRSLNEKVQSVNAKTANEIGVLIIKSLEGESIEDVTFQTFNTWKVGKSGLDNGVLLVISVADRKMRIETGKGVGGDLTDVQSHDIQDHMKPYLRNNNFYGAINLAVNEIDSAIESRKAAKSNASTPVPAASSPAVTSSSSHQNSGGCQTSTVGASDVGVGFLLTALFAMSVYFFARRHNRKVMKAAKERADKEAAEYLRRQALSKTAVSAPKKAPVVAHPNVERKETLRYSPVFSGTSSSVPSKTVVPVPIYSNPVAHISDAARNRTSAEDHRREREREAEQDARRREREEADRARAERARRDEEDRRRRDEESARSSYSSFSSSTWDSGSSSGGGGDFGGGSSGGGGSSSDW